VPNAQAFLLFSSQRPSHSVQQAIDEYVGDIWLNEHSADDPLELFHYTNLDGLKGIIGSRSLRCTHAFATNDPLEIQYGKELVEEVMSEVSAEADSDESIRFLNTLKMQVTNFGELFHHPFIACFCVSGSLLSQWRAYGSNGGGYCLGFHFTDLVESTARPVEPFNTRQIFLRRVIYQRDKQKELVGNYLRTILTAVKAEMDKWEEGGMERQLAGSYLAMQCGNTLLDMVMCFKHEAFQEENEWRLVKITEARLDPDLLRFRERNDSLIPFREVHFFDGPSRTFPLKSIHFGPSHEPRSTGTALELFVHNEATRDHSISIIPTDVNISGAGFSLR